MLYLSQLLSAPVEDEKGTRIGKIIDILAPVSTPAPVPTLVIEGQADSAWYAPAGAVEWHDDSLRLRIPIEKLSIQPPPGEGLNVPISLAQQVLDKQVIDIARKKAIRVNDVSLSDDWHILGVDSSAFSLIRRIAPAWLLGTHRGPANQPQRPPTNLIPWDQIALIESQQPELDEAAESNQSVELSRAGTPVSSQLSQARIPSGQLAELRPADIADIVHQLTPAQGARLIEGLDNETAANALEEIDTERQGHILENINAARAADILEAMEPDEAADLLARLPEELAQELLYLMKPEESEDVQELLAYEEDSAGGLMTTDYLTINAAKNVAEALEAVRNSIREQDMHPAYVYCVANELEDKSVLLGVVSLWDLLIAAPVQTLQELMETDMVTVQPDTDPRTVAEVMAKYNLLAVPVVNAGGILEGVVTVDDALDVMLPKERRRKPPRMY